MLKRLLSGLAVWTLIVGYWFALSEALPASPRVTTQALPAVPATLPVTPQIRSDQSVDRQMLAFEHHARVNMILYTGRLGQGEWATARNELNAIALTLKAGGK